MTTGPIAPSLIAFALPVVFGSIFQLLYSTTDLLFVGNMIGKNAAAAVGASGLIVTCLINLFTGISVGAGVAISQSIGEGNKKNVDQLLHAAAGFSLAAGLLLMLIGILAAPQALQFLNTPENIFSDALIYVRFYFLGMLPLIIYNVGSGVLRACGDSKSPFYILAIGGFINVLSDAFFIAVLQLGVKGAALATTVSQTFSAIAVICLLLRGNEILRLQVSKIRIERASLAKILHLGLPAGIQSMVITLSNLVVQYYINSFGSDSVAAFSAYFKLENFTYMPVLAFGQAIMTFTGQNLGAGKIDRIKKGVLLSSVLSVVTVALIAFFLLALGEIPVRWFMKEQDVVELGVQLLLVSFPVYWLNSLIEVFGGTIRGMGYSLVSMIVVLCTICGGRIILLPIIQAHFHSLRMIAAVYPITWSMAAACLFLAMLYLFRKITAKT